METCPKCSKGFEPRENRFSYGALEEWVKPHMPSTWLKMFFSVRCPHCDEVFVSNKLRFLGIITYRFMPWVILFMVLFLALFQWFV